MHHGTPPARRQTAREQVQINFNAMLVLMAVLAIALMGLTAALATQSTVWTWVSGIVSALSALALGLTLASDPYKDAAPAYI